jgi:hypothetical protein
MTSYALHADTGQGVQLAGFEVASQATLWVTALQPAGDDASGVLRGDAQKAKGQQAHVHQMCNNRAHTEVAREREQCCTAGNVLRGPTHLVRVEVVAAQSSQVVHALQSP